MPKATSKFSLKGQGFTKKRNRLEYRKPAHKRGYNNTWKKARRAFMEMDPQHKICVDCKPRIVPATDLDHIIPHRGNMDVFWDRICLKCNADKTFGHSCPECNKPSNLQPLCHRCHSRKTQRGE